MEQPTLEQLKAHAYDLIVQVQQLQAEAQAVNSEIMRRTPRPSANEIKNPVAEPE